MDSILFNLSPLKTQNLTSNQSKYSKTNPSEQDNNIPQKPGERDSLSISPEARNLLAKDAALGKTAQQNNSDTRAHASQTNDKGKDLNSKINSKKLQLDEREKLIVQNLRLTDLHVKMHEQQHMSVGGAYVRGGPVFEYATGPDGNRYAVAGEVHLDTSPIKNNPKATIQKAQTIRQAALAPADPSGADRSVAAAASAMEVKAQVELTKQGEIGQGNSSDSNKSKNASNSSPYHKQLSVYQNSKSFLAGKVINQLA